MASIGAAAGPARASATQPIPPNLARLLPKPLTPWEVSRELFERMAKQTDAPDKLYKSCEVLRGDPEYDFILKYFFQDKPRGLCIKNIRFIHNPKLVDLFEAELSRMEEAAQKLLPAWKEEEPKALRAKTLARWEQQVEQFSPVEIRASENAIDRFERAKVLPLWHGSKHVESISQIGFTFFGKHHKFHASAGPGALQSTDIGYFGSGIYFTNSPKYAAMYEKGTILLSWVSMREPYTVVSDVPVTQKCSDMRKLEGQGAYQNSNAHFIPVTSVNPSNANCMQYHPCSDREIPPFDEFVVFQSTQTLPRFCIELGVDLTSTPSTPLTLGDFLKVLPKAIFESGEVDAKVESEFTQALRKKFSLLALLHPNTPMTTKGLDFYSWFVQTDLAAISSPPYPEPMNYRALSLVDLHLPQDLDLTLDENGQNLLHHAAREGNARILQCFAKQEGLLDFQDKLGRTPLMMAAECGQYIACVVLLQGGTNKGLSDNKGRTALDIAAECGKNDVVEMLLRWPGKRLGTALMLAASKGHAETCDILLKAGQDPAQRNANGKNALHLAARNGKVEVVKLLVVYKHLLNQQDDYWDTPLMAAAITGHRAVAEVLLNSGADPAVVNKHSRYTALHYATAHRHTDIVRQLVVYKQLIDLKDDGGYTPFLKAAEAGDREICEILLKMGASVTVANNQGQNALHFASLLGGIEAVQMLIYSKQLLNAKDNAGNTPLILAVLAGRRGVGSLSQQALILTVRSRAKHAAAGGTLYRMACDTLLKAGADPVITDNNGRTALHWAAEIGDPEIVQMLAVNKHLLDAKDKDGNTPLVLAVRSRAQHAAADGTPYRMACDALLKAGADPMSIDNNGRTVLHWAAEIGDSEIVQMLVINKPLLDAKDKDGNTPLVLAAKATHHEICSILLKAAT